MNAWRCIAVSLTALLIACGPVRHVNPPTPSTAVEPDELARLVLVLRETTPNRIRHDWVPEKDIHSLRDAEPRIVLASGRDCYSELLECVRECMSRPLPRGFGHYTQGRGKGGKEDYCNQRCMRPYRDCMDLQELKPREFSTSASATDWLKQNYKTIVAGGIVVIAGVAFVVASVSAGVVILVPAVLMVSMDVAGQSPMAEAP